MDLRNRGEAEVSKPQRPEGVVSNWLRKGHDPWAAQATFYMQAWCGIKCNVVLTH